MYENEIMYKRNKFSFFLLLLLLRRQTQYENYFISITLKNNIT